MEVKLIAGTQNPIDVMYTAARTCYSAKSPIDIYAENSQEKFEHVYKDYDNFNKKWKLVKQVLDSGHQSIAEHVTMSFAIQGISRACSHQLVRHRAGIVFSQQSQRYVEIKEDWDTLFDMYDETRTEEINNNLKNIANKYFVGVTEDNYNEYIQILCSYLYKVKQGMKPEDARNVLPNATKTNIVMTVNLRELIHICNLRLCTRAQREIRGLFKLIAEEVASKYNARIADYLVPQCEVIGFCQEHKCCGRKPQINEMTAVYEAFKKDMITDEDYRQILTSVNSPKVNEKLQKLLEMKSVLED